jgi:RND family efflux transporter MFP subunit
MICHFRRKKAWLKTVNHLNIKRFRCYFFIVLFSFCLFISTAGISAKEVLTVPGLSEPIHDVLLSFEIDGMISKIYFKEGEQVKKGNTVIALNKWFEELEVKRNKLIWESKVELDSAAEREKTLKSLYDSTLELYNKTGSVSKDELEQLELEYKLAAAEHERLKIAEDREKIEYEMAQAKLDKLILRSPIQGLVSNLLLDEGESCESRQPVVRIVDTSRCILVCNIESSLGVELQKKQLVDLRIQAGSGTVQKKGKIIFISPVVDPASGLYQVKAEFDNKSGNIKPGVEGFMVLPLP